MMKAYTFLVVAILSISEMAVSDISSPFSSEERLKVDRLLRQQIPFSQNDDGFQIILAQHALNSSALVSNRTYLCNFAINKIKNEDLRCSDGFVAAAKLGCPPNALSEHIARAAEINLRALNETGLGSIQCASEVLLLLQAVYGQRVPLDSNRVARQVAGMVRPDGTFGPGPAEPAGAAGAAGALDTAHALQALANLAELDRGGFSAAVVQPVMDRRDTHENEDKDKNHKKNNQNKNKHDPGNNKKKIMMMMVRTVITMTIILIIITRPATRRRDVVPPRVAINNNNDYKNDNDNGDYN